MKIGILGAGGWGSALSIILTQNNHDVIIWAFENNVVEEINYHKKNSVFLADVQLPKTLSATNEPNDLINCDTYIITIPTAYLRQVLIGFNDIIKNKIIISGTKGIEKSTLLRVSELLINDFGIKPENFSVLTGPSHAEEVARFVPTTVVAASENLDLAREVQRIFSTSTFRVYNSSDVIGCEIGGALKNIIAIAAGMIDGLKMGDNTKAALITRGLAEISRLGVALGANPLTFSGLSGLGDLFVTCNSHLSRNRYIGEQIGKGKKLNEIISEMKMVAEGINTTESAFFLGKKHGVEMPITEQIYKILFEDTHPLSALNELMTRRTRREWWW